MYNGGIHRLVWKSQEIELAHTKFIYANILKDASAAIIIPDVEAENFFSLDIHLLLRAFKVIMIINVFNLLSIGN